MLPTPYVCLQKSNNIHPCRRPSTVEKCFGTFLLIIRMAEGTAAQAVFYIKRQYTAIFPHPDFFTSSAVQSRGSCLRQHSLSLVSYGGSAHCDTPAAHAPSLNSESFFGNTRMQNLWQAIFVSKLIKIKFWTNGRKFLYENFNSAQPFCF